MRIGHETSVLWEVINLELLHHWQKAGNAEIPLGKTSNGMLCCQRGLGLPSLTTISMPNKYKNSPAPNQVTKLPHLDALKLDSAALLRFGLPWRCFWNDIHHLHAFIFLHVATVNRGNSMRQWRQWCQPTFLLGLQVKRLLPKIPNIPTIHMLYIFLALTIDIIPPVDLTVLYRSNTLCIYIYVHVFLNINGSLHIASAVCPAWEFLGLTLYPQSAKVDVTPSETRV